MKKRITALLTSIFTLVITAYAQKPVVTFTAIPSTVCAGSTISFKDTATNSPTTWTWYFPGGSPSTYTTSFAPGYPPAITYSIPGVYYVTCVVKNSSGEDSDVVLNCVQVNSLPWAKISPPSAGICSLSTDTVYFSVTGSTGNTYNWAPTTSLSCTTCTNPRAYPNTTTVYTLTATGTDGCIATYTDTVTVGSIKTKITGKDSICAGYTDTLIASGGSNNPGSNSKYFWNGINQTSTQIYATPTTTTVYTLTLVDNACPSPGNSSTAYFTVHPYPLPQYTLASPGYDTIDNSICYYAGANPPSSTTITAASKYGNTYQYYWYGPFGVEDTNIFTVSPAATTTYTLVTRNFGCYVDSLIKIKVNYPPKVAFTGASNLCQGSSTTITACCGTQYHWSTGATTSSINVAPLISHTYTIQVSAGACYKDTTFTVNIDTMPNVKFKGDTSICIQDSTTIYVSGGYTYLWNTGSTADSIFVKGFSSSQTYFVTVTKGACSKDSEQVTVKIYPQPKPVLYPIDSLACEFDSVPLTVTGGNYYKWAPSNSGLNHYLFYGDTDRNNAAPFQSTTYNVNVCTWGCCKDTSLVVLIKPGPSGTVCCNETVPGGTAVPLSVTFPTGTDFVVEGWSPSTGLSCSNCPNPTATVYNTTTYVVTLENTFNFCMVEDSVTVDIFNCNVFVPDIFSPNGDGVDDYLYVRSLCLKKMDFAVFDRWGNKIFETENQNTPWNGTYKGKPVEIGTYMWYLTGLLNDGTNISKSGNVTVVR